MRKLYSLSLALLAALGACVSRGAYPSTVVLPDSSYGKLWYPDGFRAARETPLRSAADNARTALRMILPGTWGGANIRRLEQHRETWWVIRKAVDESRPAPRLTHVDSARVTPEQVADLLRVVTASGYWTAPRQSCRDGLDGYFVVLEARVGTTYSALRCWVPEETGAPAIVATMHAFDALYNRVFGERR